MQKGEKMFCFLRKLRFFTVHMSKTLDLNDLQRLTKVDEPVGRVKIQTTSENIQQYYTPKHLIRE